MADGLGAHIDEYIDVHDHIIYTFQGNEYCKCDIKGTVHVLVYGTNAVSYIFGPFKRKSSLLDQVSRSCSVGFFSAC